MAQNFAQVPVTDRMSMQKLVKKHIDTPGMNASLLTDSRCIVRHDHSDGHTQLKGPMVKSPS